ncbi:hypothetical protein C8R44DRAFT_859100 [Mycena epipterygia]|nr:hypothetical protein C8R44DRAFT_859100 [Mycena epipterygia]
MFAKLFPLTFLFALAVAAPVSVLSRTADASIGNPIVKRDNEGPYTDANGYRCTQHYTVRPGDTCSSVTIAFGLSLATLVNMNPEIGEDCTALNVGQQYCVQTVISGNTGRSFVFNGFP